MARTDPGSTGARGVSAFIVERDSPGLTTSAPYRMMGQAGSPVGAAANLKGKLLLIHNIQDDNVLFGNALQMMNAFQLAGKPFETMIYPQKSHGVMGRAATHMRQQQLDFLKEALK